MSRKLVSDVCASCGKKFREGDEVMYVSPAIATYKNLTSLAVREMKKGECRVLFNSRGSRLVHSRCYNGEENTSK